MHKTLLSAFRALTIFIGLAFSSGIVLSASEILIEASSSLPQSVSNLSLQDTEQPLLVFERSGTIYVTDINGVIESPIAAATGYSFGLLPNEAKIVFDPSTLDFTLPLTQDESMLWDFGRGIYSQDNTKFVYSESKFASGQFKINLIDLTVDNTTTAQILNELDTNSLPLHPIGWQDDNTLLMVEKLDSGNILSLWKWDINTNASTKILTFDHSTYSVALSSDSSRLALQTSDNEVVVVELESGEATKRLFTDDEPITFLGWIDYLDVPQFTADLSLTVTAQAAQGFLFWPTYETRAISVPWSSTHKGIDIANGMNFQIVAAAPGTVIFAGENPFWDTQTRCEADYPPDNEWGVTWNGNVWMIRINHSTSEGIYESQYLHIEPNSITTLNGATVQAGEAIGQAGNTGCSSSVHLHFEVRKNGVDQNLNTPLLWIDDNNDGFADFAPPPSPGIIYRDAASADYDGDGKVDLSVKMYSGVWLIDYAINGFAGYEVLKEGYGLTDAIPVPADYDGDGRADLSVKSNAGVWLIDYAINGFNGYEVLKEGYGLTDTVPVPADYDGDGRADLSVKSNAGVWLIDYAINGFNGYEVLKEGYGIAEAFPVPNDYDGDSKVDLSVKTEAGLWFIDYACNAFGTWDSLSGQTGCTPPPLRPKPIAPAGTVLSDSRPTFSWSVSPGATRYEMQIRTLNTPIAPVITIPTTNYIPSTPLLHGTYYWRIRALNAANIASPWSATVYVTIVSGSNSAPQLNYYVVNTPTLTWNSVTWATQYEIQVDSSGVFTDSLEYTETVSANSLAVTTSPLANGIHYWRVRAKNATTVGEWSMIEAFFVVE
jgi:hypothetical protein